jgi:hypothetical protein
MHMIVGNRIVHHHYFRTSCCPHRVYAQVVYANIDACLVTVRPEEWERPLDLTPVGMGHQTVGFLLTRAVLDGGDHGGKISAVNELEGLQG